MKVKAFLILMVVTVATVMLSAELGERWFAPGMERAVFIGIVTCLVVFPLSRFFEYIGWVKGSWNISGDKDMDDGPGTGADISTREGRPSVDAPSTTAARSTASSEAVSPGPVTPGSFSPGPVSAGPASPSRHQGPNDDPRGTDPRG